MNQRLYRNTNYTELGKMITRFDWNCLNILTLDEAVDYFNRVFLSFVHKCIPSKEVTVRSNDKPWLIMKFVGSLGNETD